MMEQEINETLKDLDEQEIELQKTASEIQSKLETIWNKKNELQEELFNLKSKGIEIQLSNWYINTYEQSSYHYTIFTLIYVKEITDKNVKYIKYDLRKNDGDSIFNVVNVDMNLKSFKKNLYVTPYQLISEEEAKQYIEKGLKLEVTDED